MSATTRNAKMARLVIENKRLENLVFEQSVKILELMSQRNEARRYAVKFYRAYRSWHDLWKSKAGNG